MNPRFDKQRGAVTLMGALFITITLVLMVVVLNRMAASDILDTAVQNDSVDALFIAETGVEHASFLYAGGTACAALATVPSTNAGRGSFTINSATDVGTDCQIQITGAITSTGADQVRRTTDAVLRLSAGDAWSVGDNGTILRWNGSSWNPNVSGTAEDLNGVHCVSANECWAVGDNGTILRWAGGSWSPYAAPSNTVDLTAVSCAPLNPNYCFASGFDTSANEPRVLGWDGVQWTTSMSFGFGVNTDISCPDINCFASNNVFDFLGQIYGYNGGAWSQRDLIIGALNGIDCVDGQNCWAVGNRSGNRFVFDRQNGGSWGRVRVSSPGNQADLTAVSCVDLNDCWAVGERRGDRFTFVRWDGGNWIAQPLTDGTNREDLNGVHCAATDNCWAVGNFTVTGNTLRWDGGNWTHVPATLTTENLNDVFVLGGGGAAGVSLVQWREFISN